MFLRYPPRNFYVSSYCYVFYLASAGIDSGLLALAAMYGCELWDLDLDSCAISSRCNDNYNDPYSTWSTLSVVLVDCTSLSVWQ